MYFKVINHFNKFELQLFIEMMDLKGVKLFKKNTLLPL